MSWLRRPMVRRWERFRNPWDREYAKRGRLWRGRASVEPLPEHAGPPGPVLEVGCGDGKFLGALRNAGYRGVGLDASRHALRLAEGERVLGDARRLPFRDGAFPVVAARYLLAALRGTDRARAASELVRCTRPGGILLVEEFSVRDFRFGSGTHVEPGTFERNQGITTHYFEQAEIAGLFPGQSVLAAEETVRALRIRGRAHRRALLRLVVRRTG